MSKTYSTLKIVQKYYTRIDGTQNVFVRLTINRVSKYYPLNIYVRPKHLKGMTVSRADPDHIEKTMLIENDYIKAKKIVFDYRIKNEPLTFNKFKQDFYNINYGNDSFLDYYESQVNKLKSTLSINTIRAYNSQLEKLREFRKDVLFNDIDQDFLNDYKGFLINKKKNNKNTVIKSLTYIKSILNKAVSQGIIKKNPMQGYKLGSINGDRQFLTLDELTTLENILKNNDLKRNKANVLKYFLFCCYTGLRYQDIKKLRYRDIINNEYVSIQMIKTKEFVKIPLSEKAKKLIPAGRLINQPIFRVLSDQPTNRYLKDIMKTAGIKKKISFHCARHTFATVSKSLGLDYDVISKILGHTDIKTTKIYTKYELDYLTREMDKWN